MGKSAKSSKKNSLDAEPSSRNKGLPDGWTRYTILIRTEHLDKFKAFAFWTRIPLKSILDKVFEKFLSKRKIHPIPTVKDELIDQFFEETKISSHKEK